MQIITYARRLAIAFVVVLCATRNCRAESRKALLLGIGNYMDRPADPPRPWQPHGFRSVPVMGKSRRQRIKPLSGPENDIRNMQQLLTERYHFAEKDIHVLRDGDATADRIIEEFQTFLVKDAQPKDIRVFYFSGHGSRILNKSPMAKPNQLDEAIVPADSLLGVPDIRDKELGRLYQSAADAGVTLTVIQDSCYSGTAARGTVVYRDQDSNEGQWVVDPEKKTRDAAKSAEQKGVLVFSASQDDQKSVELPIDGRQQGLFTWALFQVLWQTPDERVDRVMLKARNLMASIPQAAQGLSQDPNPQEPAVGGAGRLQRGLLGQNPSSDPAAAAVVMSTEGKTVQVTGGPATGLYPGCELVRLGKTPIGIRITRMLNIYSSEAESIDGSALADVVRNDEFKVTKWSVPAKAAMRVYVPPALARDRLQAAAREFAKLRRPNRTWVSGDERDSATHFLSWRGEGPGWVLTEAGKSAEASLGANPRLADLEANLRVSSVVRLLLIAPPTTELTEALQLGPQSKVAFAIDVMHKPDASAEYALEGELRPDGHLQYAWVLASTAKVEGALTPYPMVTPWVLTDPGKEASVRAGEKLATLAGRLGRICAWLRLPNPPNELKFPYHLELVEASSKKLVGNRPLVIGERLKLALTASPDDLAEYKKNGASPAYVYVFLLNSKGKSTLFVPDPEEQQGLNKVPILSATDNNPDPAPPFFLLTTEDYDVEVADPPGTDSYFLLATSTPLPDPSILEFEGVEDRGHKRGGEDPLADLLLGVGSTRIAARGVRTDWRVEWRPYRSVAGK